MIRNHKTYWDFLRQSECSARGCYRKGVTIHHVHGGSCRGLSGMALKSSDWFTIGLCVDHHTGDHGIDNGLSIYRGIPKWEQSNGRQADMLMRRWKEYGISASDLECAVTGIRFDWSYQKILKAYAEMEACQPSHRSRRGA